MTLKPAVKTQQYITIESFYYNTIHNIYCISHQIKQKNFTKPIDSKRCWTAPVLQVGWTFSCWIMSETPTLNSGTETRITSGHSCRSNTGLCCYIVTMWISSFSFHTDLSLVAGEFCELRANGRSSSSCSGNIWWIHHCSVFGGRWVFNFVGHVQLILIWIRAVRYDDIYRMDEIKSLSFHIMFYRLFRGVAKYIVSGNTFRSFEWLRSLYAAHHGREEETNDHKTRSSLLNEGLLYMVTRF